MKVYFSLCDELMYIGSNPPEEAEYINYMDNYQGSYVKGLYVDNTGLVIRLALDENGRVIRSEDSADNLFCAGVCFEMVATKPSSCMVGENVDLVSYEIDSTAKKGRIVWSVEHGIKVDSGFLKIMDMSMGYYGLFELPNKSLDLCVSMVIVESDMDCLLLVRCWT